MTVNDFRNLVSGIHQFAVSAGISAKAQAELELIRSALEPFKDMGIDQFGTFLQTAETYQRTGTLPVPTKGRKTTSAASTPEVTQLVENYSKQLAELYEEVTQESVGYNVIDDLITRMSKALNKTGVLEVHKGFGLKGKPTKGDALSEIKQVLYDRKGSAERGESIKG